MDELVIRFRWRKRYLFLWITICRVSQQVISFFIGDRSRAKPKRESLQQMWWRLPNAYKKKLIYTDGYNVYKDFLGAWQHRPSEKGSGRTSVIEGLNNKWRNRVSGLVRRTVCVQPAALDDLERRLLLVFTQHNQQRTSLH